MIEEASLCKNNDLTENDDLKKRMELLNHSDISKVNENSVPQTATEINANASSTNVFENEVQVNQTGSPDQNYIRDIVRNIISENTKILEKSSFLNNSGILSFDNNYLDNITRELNDLTRSPEPDLINNEINDNKSNISEIVKKIISENKKILEKATVLSNKLKETNSQSSENIYNDFIEDITGKLNILTQLPDVDKSSGVSSVDFASSFNDCKSSSEQSNQSDHIHSINSDSSVLNKTSISTEEVDNGSSHHYDTQNSNNVNSDVFLTPSQKSTGSDSSESEWIVVENSENISSKKNINSIENLNLSKNVEKLSHHQSISSETTSDPDWDILPIQNLAPLTSKVNISSVDDLNMENTINIDSASIRISSSSSNTSSDLISLSDSDYSSEKTYFLRFINLFNLLKNIIFYIF